MSRRTAHRIAGVATVRRALIEAIRQLDRCDDVAQFVHQHLVAVEKTTDRAPQ